MPGRKGVWLVDRRKGPIKAECEGCEWRAGEVTRERARLHVKNTGHKVVVAIEDMTVYGPSETER